MPVVPIKKYEIMAVLILVTELHREFEHQFLLNVMTYRLKSSIYQGQQQALIDRL